MREFLVALNAGFTSIIEKGLHTPISTSLFLTKYAKENLMPLGIPVRIILVVYPQIQHDGFCQ